MKRLKYLLLLFLFMPFMVSGLEVSNIDITDIDFSSDWIVVTRDNYNEVLKEQGFTDGQIASTYSLFLSNDYYIDAFTADYSKELFLIVKNETSSLDNMSSLSDSEILSSTKVLRDKYKVYNATEDIYTTNNGIKYLKMSYLDSGLNLYVTDYITIVNNMLYQFKVQKKNTSFVDSEITDIENIVSSAVYNTDSIDELPGEVKGLISTNNNRLSREDARVIIIFGGIFGFAYIIGVIVAVVLATNNRNRLNK